MLPSCLFSKSSFQPLVTRSVYQHSVEDSDDFVVSESQMETEEIMEEVLGPVLVQEADDQLTSLLGEEADGSFLEPGQLESFVLRSRDLVFRQIRALYPTTDALMGLMENGPALDHFKQQMLLVLTNHIGHAKINHLTERVSDLQEKNTLLERKMSQAAMDSRMPGYINHGSAAGQQLYDANIEKIATEMARGTQHASVAFYDLDGFGKINKGGKHDVGNVVLASVARRLFDAMRTKRGDFLSRFGGDEVTHHMPDTNLAQALTATQRMRRTLGDHPVYVAENLEDETLNPERETIIELTRAQFYGLLDRHGFSESYQHIRREALLRGDRRVEINLGEGTIMDIEVTASIGVAQCPKPDREEVRQVLPDPTEEAVDREMARIIKANFEVARKNADEQSARAKAAGGNRVYADGTEISTQNLSQYVTAINQDRIEA